MGNPISWEPPIVLTASLRDSLIKHLGGLLAATEILMEAIEKLEGDWQS
jgi:hypothetical protein